MSDATWFWSSLVQLNFLRKLTAGPPASTNLARAILFSVYGG
jgi:hypothetical protein